MPLGYYIFILCLLSISLVNARKSERDEYQYSNTMSREAGENHDPVQDTINIDNNQGWSEDSSDYPASGGGQNDEWGSGNTDDEDDSSDDFSGGERDDIYPPIVAPSRRPGPGTGVGTDPPFIVGPELPKEDKPVNSHDPDNGINYEETDTGPNVEIGAAPKGEDEDDLEESEEDHHEGENLSRSIIQTPGLLPGIIGGAVVGLLCAVLLVMFIVYRMRKKDEGSYALEEPTKMTSPSRGYTRAPTKEYWA